MMMMMILNVVVGGGGEGGGDGCRVTLLSVVCCCLSCFLVFNFHNVLLDLNYLMHALLLTSPLLSREAPIKIASCALCCN